PAMAAFITSYGRYKLLRAIRAVGWLNVMYVDTDTIVTNAVGAKRLVNDGFVAQKTLGALELRAGPVTFESHGIKYYIEGGKVTCAGAQRGIYSESADGRGRWYTPAASEGSRRKHATGSVSYLADWPK